MRTAGDLAAGKTGARDRLREAEKRRTRSRSHFFSRSILTNVPSKRFSSHSSTTVSLPG